MLCDKSFGCLSLSGFGLHNFMRRDINVNFVFFGAIMMALPLNDSSFLNTSSIRRIGGNGYICWNWFQSNWIASTCAAVTSGPGLTTALFVHSIWLRKDLSPV